MGLGATNCLTVPCSLDSTTQTPTSSSSKGWLVLQVLHSRYSSFPWISCMEWIFDTQTQVTLGIGTQKSA